MFDKSKALFPVKDEYTYLNNCGVAPLYEGARQAIAEFMEVRTRTGAAVFSRYGNPLDNLRSEVSQLIKTTPENISFMRNTAEALSMIANGYPFEPGDEIISYIHEYPSNHYPWLLPQGRGVKLKLLPDDSSLLIEPVSGQSGPTAWSLETLKETVTERTRIVALSHVQFTSGFAADLEELGSYCRKQGIDLVVDVAQSIGSLALDVERFNIAACAGSGWKWLLGPVGCGLLYTTPEFRSKLSVTVAGADLMEQGFDYLDHTWQPHRDGRLFEYSTTEVSFAEGITRCCRDLFNHYGVEKIQSEIIRLQDLFLSELDRDRFTPLLFPAKHRSGILALQSQIKVSNTLHRLQEQGLFVTERGGYLRIAPHFYNDDDEMKLAAKLLNELTPE